MSLRLARAGPDHEAQTRPGTGRPVKISVALVTYQNAAEIGPCLHSLHRSSSHPLQILVADNASTDGTREVIEKTISAIPRPPNAYEMFFHQANLGFTRALNFLLARSTGDLVLILNADTEWPLAGQAGQDVPWPRTGPYGPYGPGRLGQGGGLDCLAAHLLAAPTVGVVAPQLLDDDGSVQPSCRRFPKHRDIFLEMTGLSTLLPRRAFFNGWKMGDFNHTSARDVDQPQGACLLVRHQVIEQVGLWDERFPMFFSDVDWCRRVWAAGWRIRFVPEVKVVHRRGASVSQRRPAMIWSSHRSFFDYFRKYHGGWRGQILNCVAGAALLVAAICRIAGHYLVRWGRRAFGKFFPIR